MSAMTLSAFIARCRVLCQPRSQVPDAELLRRFTQQRDADAFGQLLERYASLVWGVCRRVLMRESDCEDAFQAVFLALLRRPEAVDPNQSLGAWLHTVTVRVARRTLAQSRRQQPVAVVAEQTTAGAIVEEASSREMLRLVDEEIERLPIAVRTPLILCCLEGRTRDEAAEVLGCSVAAVKSRLERGRGLLRKRLAQRGVQLPAAFLVLGLTSEHIHAALWTKTMQLALHTPTPAVAALAEAALPALSTSVQGKLILGVLLLAMGAAGAIGHVLSARPAETPATTPPALAVAEPKKPEAPRARVDRQGDPLPDGAIVRPGTVRWRHGFYVNALAYSPDGKKIAVVGGGRAISLWDTATGKEIHQFPNRSQPNAVAFSPDGKILATTDTPLCRLWDVATGTELRQLKGHENGLRSVAFAPDGKTLATSSYDGTTRIWETSTGKELRRLDCKQGFLYSAAYSPDGKILATGGEKGTIRLWDAATGAERHQLQGHEKTIWKLAFSPDGKHLASSSDDETIRLWDAASGRQVRVFGEKLAGARAPLAFSADGVLLAFGRLDGTVLLWDMARGEEKCRWQVGAGNVGRALAFSPDSKSLATGWDGCVRLWDAATGREKCPSVEHRGPVGLLRFLPEGKELISIGNDQRLLVWDLGTNRPRQPFSWSSDRYSYFALSPGGQILAVDGWPDSLLRLWNVRAGKPGLGLGKPQNSPFRRSIAFSPDGCLAAASADDRVIHVWDTAKGKEVRQFEETGENVMGLTFSPDGKLLAGGTGQPAAGVGAKAVRLWDVNSGKEIRSFTSAASVFFSLAFSPDGNVLAAAGGDAGNNYAGHVQLWDTATGKKLCRHTGHHEWVGPIAFSPDGKLIASGASFRGWKDCSVHVWEAATGRLLWRFEGL